MGDVQSADLFRQLIADVAAAGDTVHRNSLSGILHHLRHDPPYPQRHLFRIRLLGGHFFQIHSFHTEGAALSDLQNRHRNRQCEPLRPAASGIQHKLTA